MKVQLSTSKRIAFVNRSGAKWATYAIPIVGIAASVPSIWATLLVATHTPASPPWQAASLGAVLSVLGFALSLGRGSDQTLKEAPTGITTS